MYGTQQVMRPIPEKTGQGFGVWKALGFMFLGMFLTVLGALLWFMLFTGTPLSTSPLPLPASSGKVDLSAQVSQEYVNREIAATLEKKPISVLGIADVKQVVVEFTPDSVVAVTRITALGRQFDFKLKNTVQVKNNKVSLVLLENSNVEGFGIPIPSQVLGIVVETVNSNISNYINQQIEQVGLLRDCATSKPLGRTPTLLSVKLQPGTLTADFALKID